MKATIIKVNRYSYESKKDGSYHEGCVLSLLLPTAQSEDCVGYDVKEFRVDIKLFEKLKSLFDENKAVDITMDFVPMKNGNYYSKLKSIAGIEL